MNFVGVTSKSEMIAQEIKENIKNGSLKPGDKLQTVRTIAEKFSVSISVVQLALKNLEKKNLIERRDRSGIFIKSPKPDLIKTQNHVLLSLDSRGHVYGELSFFIREKLLEQGLIPVSVNNFEESEKERKNNLLKQIIETPFHSIIFNGDSYSRNPFLKGRKNIRSVAIASLSYSGNVPDRAVFFDLENAIFQCAEHLVSKGAQKIMLAIVKPLPDSYSHESLFLHPGFQMINGYNNALKKYNLLSSQNIYYRTLNMNEELENLFKSARRPDAILCDSDYTAVQAYSAAMRAGIDVPEQLLITGGYNTPWSTECPVKLTSFSFDLKKTAEHIVRLAIEDKIKNKVIYIQPELQIRESSGGQKIQKNRKS